MRRFSNIFIVLFLVDASLSLIDELLVASTTSLPLFSGVRYFVAYVVIALSLVIFACLGVDRRLPKRVLLPLTLYISWSTLALWPLSGIIGHESLGLVAAVGQLLLGGVAIVLIRGLCGQSLLSRELFLSPMFGLRNTLVFTAINLLFLPIVLIYTVLATTSYYLEQQTAGFLRLSPIGIYMSERSYHLDKKAVLLAGMMHIGQEDYYKDLADSISAEGAIILTEGVTDQDGLLNQQFNYGKIAGILGLSSQDKMRIDGNPVDLENLDKADHDDNEWKKPDIARADIDLNRFDPKTIEFLNALGRTLFSGKPLVEGLSEYNLWVNDNMSSQRIASVMSDIIDKRNKVVITSMVRTLEHYDTVIIPWGAMHMPAIESAVFEQGFEPGAARERLSLDFRTIPYAELWEKWSKQTGEK